ncbi:MAG: transglycosylase SLT domain-containing protein [Bacteroidota bacterium]
MRIFSPRKSLENQQGFYIVPRTKASKRGNTVKAISLFGILLFASNILTYSWFGSTNQVANAAASSVSSQLYLIDEAGRFIPETDRFEQKVQQVGDELGVPAEWLMAVMYSESRFDPGVSNAKGSGAVGLIQFMVPTVKELNVRMGTKYYMKDILAMTAVEQMELVAEYFHTIKERYGEYKSLTDLYLAVLYPKARGQDYCYALYAKPTQAYLMNSGLDENKDGRVTVSDIDKRMQRMFPTAYIAQK